MSYTFGIWQHEDGEDLIPNAIQELFEAEWVEEKSPSQTIEDLIRAIAAQFSDSEDTPDAVWDSTPLIEQAKGRTFYPGVRLGVGDDVLETVLIACFRKRKSVDFT